LALSLALSTALLAWFHRSEVPLTTHYNNILSVEAIKYWDIGILGCMSSLMLFSEESYVDMSGQKKPKFGTRVALAHSGKLERPSAQVGS